MQTVEADLKPSISVAKSSIKFQNQNETRWQNIHTYKPQRWGQTSLTVLWQAAYLFLSEFAGINEMSRLTEDLCHAALVVKSLWTERWLLWLVPANNNTQNFLSYWIHCALSKTTESAGTLNERSTHQNFHLFNNQKFGFPSTEYITVSFQRQCVICSQWTDLAVLALNSQQCFCLICMLFTGGHVLFFLRGL